MISLITGCTVKSSKVDEKEVLKLFETDLKRLRLSSLDIADINDDLKEILFNEERMMPHIHISFKII